MGVLSSIIGNSVTSEKVIHIKYPFIYSEFVLKCEIWVKRASDVGFVGKLPNRDKIVLTAWFKYVFFFILIGQRPPSYN